MNYEKMAKDIITTVLLRTQIDFDFGKDTGIDADFELPDFELSVEEGTEEIIIKKLESGLK